MDFGNTQILNEILKFFQDASITGMLNLIPHAKALVGVLAIIDLCSTWTLYDGEMKMSQMISKIMKLGAFLFIIMYWNDINHAIMVLPIRRPHSGECAGERRCHRAQQAAG